MGFVQELSETNENLGVGLELLQIYDDKEAYAKKVVDDLLLIPPMSEQYTSTTPTVQRLVQHHQRLQNLDISQEQLCNLLLIAIFEGKLNHSFKRNWLEKQAQGSWKDATSEFFLKTIQEHLRLDRRTQRETPGKPKTQLPTTPKPTVPASFTTKGEQCPLCHKQGHCLDTCYSAKSQPLSTIFDLIREHKLCTLCLRTDHGANAKNCTRAPCAIDKCGKRNHRLLHRNKRAPAGNPKTDGAADSSQE